MSDEVRDQLCRLAQTDTSPDARLTLILAAQHRRVGRLGAWLLDLAELRIDLDPWEPAETAAYLVFAMRQAGRPTRAFSDAGTERLHQLAQGIPRRVKQLADLALLAAAASELLEIDADIVESVFEELGTVRPTGERASALAE
jgi:type II secretory pathway predicted ATPase ExeA